MALAGGAATGRPALPTRLRWPPRVPALQSWMPCWPPWERAASRHPHACPALPCPRCCHPPTRHSSAARRAPPAAMRARCPPLPRCRHQCWLPCARRRRPQRLCHVAPAVSGAAVGLGIWGCDWAPHCHLLFHHAHDVACRLTPGMPDWSPLHTSLPRPPSSPTQQPAGHGSQHPRPGPPRGGSDC